MVGQAFDFIIYDLVTTYVPKRAKTQTARPAVPGNRWF